MRLPFVSRAQHERALSEAKQEISLNQLLERMAAQGQVISGESVTPANAMKCTAVHGIVRALTNAIGTYPVSVVDEGISDGKPTITYKPAHLLTKRLQKPNAIQSSSEFFRLAMQHIALYGNFYALIGSGQTGPISSLRPIEDPDSVSVESQNWNTGVTWRVHFDGGQRLVNQSQMLHVSSGILSADGITGQSPIENVKQAIGICLAAERLIANLYGQGDVATLAFIGGHFKDKDTYDLWKKALPNAVTNGRMLLPEGMTVQELGFKPIDAQLVEMIRQKSREIFSAYGVPPHKLADLEFATFSNIEEQSLEFVRDVAKPYVKLFEQSMTRDLLSDADRAAGLTIKFDMQEATEGKFNERVQGFYQLYNSGVMNPNEIRAKLGLNPRKDPGGDEYVSPANMRPTSNVSSNNSGASANGTGLGGGSQVSSSLPN